MNNKNSVVVASSSHITFPVSAALTGTFSCTNDATTGITVVGVGTKFTTEILPNGSGSFYGWLVDITHDEIRKITLVTDDLHLNIEEAFSNAQSGANVIWIEPSDYVSITAIFSGSGTIDGVSVPAGTYSWSKSGRDMSGVKDFVDPIIVNDAAVLIGLK